MQEIQHGKLDGQHSVIYAIVSRLDLHELIKAETSILEVCFIGIILATGSL